MPATFSIPRTNDLERVMTAVMIGVDPHKATHTAVVIGPAEEPLGELQVRACPSQAGQLLAWAQGGRSGSGRSRARPGWGICRRWRR